MLLRKLRILIILLWLFISFFSPFAHAQTTKNLSITATVAAQESDYYTLLEQTTSGSQFSQDSTINYKITYGTHINSLQSFTLQASWSRGSFADPGVPAVDVLDYVTGTATKAYNQTSPIIDLVNRTISWTIADFPANSSNQTVTFSLKTTGQYTGSSQVNFTVNGQILGAGVNSSISSVTASYLYNPPPTPTPGPTSTGPTSTPAPGPTATPGPQPTTQITPLAKQLPILKTIAVTTVDSNQINLSFLTSQDNRVTVKYGSSSANLNNNIKSLTYLTNQDLILSNLAPDTNYYFQVVSTDKNQSSVTSDIYVVRTAAQSDKPQVDYNSYLALSSNVVLYDGQNSENQQHPPAITIPKTTTYTFRFALKKVVGIKQIKVFVRNSTVLGISSNDQMVSDVSADVIEVQPGIFEGRLRSPVTNGYYEMYVRINDTKGNITENKLADLHVINYLTIYNQQNQQPLENAEVFFYLYDGVQKKYLFIPPENFSIQNPASSDRHGQIIATLPPGKYKASISLIGYQKKDVFFTIDISNKDVYPAVYLVPQHPNILNFFGYYLNLTSDLIASTQVYLQTLSQSSFLLRINAINIITLLIVLSFFSLSAKMKIPVSSFFSYFLHIYQVKLPFSKSTEVIKGRVVEKKSGKLISGADVYLVNRETGKIFCHYSTDKDGSFNFTVHSREHYVLQVFREGYIPYFNHHVHPYESTSNDYLITISQQMRKISPTEQFQFIVHKLMAFIFDLLLIFSFILEIILSFTFGWVTTLPFIVMSFINVALWLIHIIHLRSERNIT